jgi:acyl-coenzyme A thioesterase PaaI-like protein
LLAAVLDDAMGRSTAVFKRWVVTGRMNVRYRAGARSGEPLRVEGWIVRYQKRLVAAAAQAKTASGELVAEADGTYLPVPEDTLAQMVAAWPGFAEYLGER